MVAIKKASWQSGQLKKFATVSVAIGVSFAVALSGSNLASAAVVPDDELSSLVSDAVPVDAGTPGQELRLSDAGDTNVAVGRTATVELPDIAIAEVIVSQIGVSDAPELTIGLPVEAAISAPAERSGDSALSYEGDDTQTVVQPFSDGLRISTVLENSAAPTRYTYELPVDVTPRLNMDGSVILESTFGDPDVDGDSVTIGYGTVGVPWATDANGAPVPTHYEVAEGSLVQVVETTASTAYPVVADPTFWWGWNAFISNAVHQKVLKLMMGGAAAVTIANLFVSYMPNAYVQLAVRLATAMAVAGTYLWNVCNFNGRGVIVGQSWLANGIPPVIGTTFIRLGYFCLPR